MISLITGTYTTVTPIIDHAKKNWWSCGQNKQQADLHKTFHSSSNTQELGGYLWNYVSLSFRWLGMAATQIKRRWWVSGVAQRLFDWSKITKTIVINVGSKERDNEEITGSLERDRGMCSRPRWIELGGQTSPRWMKTSSYSNQQPISHTICNSSP